MISWLLDTNVISETKRRRPNQQVLEWFRVQDYARLFLSTVTISELAYGAAVHHDPVAQAELYRWIERDIRPAYEGQIIEVSERVLLRWISLMQDMARKQSFRPPVDLLLAASALEHDLHVATRDITPFVAAGVPTLNPFTGERFNGA